MNDGFFFLSSSSMCLALTITYDDDALQSQAGGLMHVEYIYIHTGQACIWWIKNNACSF